MANAWDWILGTKAFNDNIARIKTVAQEKGYALNPDQSRVEKVVGLMTMNNQQYGAYYCPCKQSRPLDTARDAMCPCQPLDQEVAAEGRCHCKLFFKK